MIYGYIYITVCSINISDIYDIYTQFVASIHTYNFMFQHFRSIKSTFEFRTFDPEGVVFYGDNHSGDEWFILALHGGVPEIQIYKADILVSVTGGPRLDDGQWHLVRELTRPMK